MPVTYQNIPTRTAILNPHSNQLKSGKRTTGTGLNGQQQVQSVGGGVKLNPFTNQRYRLPVK